MDDVINWNFDIERWLFHLVYDYVIDGAWWCWFDRIQSKRGNVVSCGYRAFYPQPRSVGQEAGEVNDGGNRLMRMFRIDSGVLDRLSSALVILLILYRVDVWEGHGVYRINWHTIFSWFFDVNQTTIYSEWVMNIRHWIFIEKTFPTWTHYECLDENFKVLKTLALFILRNWVRKFFFVLVFFFSFYFLFVLVVEKREGLL